MTEQQTTQDALRDQFISMFFKGQSLQRIMTHLSNTCPAAYVDPVTTTVTMILKNPIQCAINEQGICPFKAYPTMTFPFSLMDATQHRFINKIQLAENRTVVSIHSLMVTPNHVQFCAFCMIDRTVYGLYGSIMSKIISDCLQGGGRLLLFYESASPYYIPHSEALIEICRVTLSHPTYAVEQRLQVCNIVLQRVAALVNISNSTLKQVNDSLRSRIVEIQQNTQTMVAA
ncbi:hypothetical protein T484DRAFT_1758251 [Baffinella frigidus]|nr:hypothetical protein T484DRAFT_1758251 [Cryptophyta sp. CCMP2293]